MRSAARRATLGGLVVASACSSASSGRVPGPGPTSATAVAGLSIAGEERHYDVTGSSVAELREAMRRHGPRDHEGARRDAVTVWDLEWTYRNRRTGHGCALRDVRVTLTVTITLPRWTPPAGAPARLVRSWNHFRERVMVHEAGHEAVAQQTARDLYSVLSTLSADDCERLWDRAARVAGRVVEEGRARNRAYDAETQHGQTQGVVLAP